MSKRIAILIPCFNEGKTIGKVVVDMQIALPDAEIYVYDNNSTDDTIRQAMLPGIHIRREPRQGKGNVIRQMLMDIDADCYVIVDGDDTYPAEKAQALVNGVLKENYDMVIGDRLSATYFKENNRQFHNFGNRLVRGLINRIFESDIQDIMTGYRAFSRRFAKAMPVMSKGFEIETEMTIFALDRNFRIKQIPIEYRDRPEGSESKLNTLYDGHKVIKTIFTLFRDYKPLKFFSFIALLIFIVAVIVLIPILVEYFKTGLVPRFPTLIVCGFMILFSMLIWICGMLLEVMLQRHRQLLELLGLHRKDM